MAQIDMINGLIGSIAVKAPVKVATTANITLAGAQTIDGILLTADASGVTISYYPATVYTYGVVN